MAIDQEVDCDQRTKDTKRTRNDHEWLRPIRSEVAGNSTPNRAIETPEPPLGNSCAALRTALR